MTLISLLEINILIFEKMIFLIGRQSKCTSSITFELEFILLSFLKKLFHKFYIRQIKYIYQPCPVYLLQCVKY